MLKEVPYNISYTELFTRDESTFHKNIYNIGNNDVLDK